MADYKLHLFTREMGVYCSFNLRGPGINHIEMPGKQHVCCVSCLFGCIISVQVPQLIFRISVLSFLN